MDSADPPRRAQLYAIGFGAAAVLTIVDQIVKIYVERVLEPGVFVPWLGTSVGWQLVYNPGGAWGIPAPSWLFLIVTVVVVVVVARALPRSLNLAQATAFGMLLSGALGNVADRLFRPGDGSFGGGYVVDFVAWGSFPRFNVADSAITVGFVLLVIAVWHGERTLDHDES
ncbi:MAG: signal peptidase II [Nitriliruptoraceae bacterium]